MLEKEVKVLKETVQHLKTAELQLTASLHECKVRTLEDKDEMAEQVHTLKEELRQAHRDLADERMAHLATQKELVDEKSEHQMSKLVAEKQQERDRRDRALLRDELEDSKRDVAAQKAHFEGQVERLELAVAKSAEAGRERERILLQDEREREQERERENRRREQEQEREREKEREAEQRQTAESRAREGELRRQVTSFLREDLASHLGLVQQELSALQLLCDTQGREREQKCAQEAAERRALLERAEVQERQLASAEAAVTAAATEKSRLFENLALLKEEKAKLEATRDNLKIGDAEKAARMEHQQTRLDQLSAALHQAEVVQASTEQAARAAQQHAEVQKEEQQRDLAALRDRLEQLQQYVSEYKAQAAQAQRDHTRATEEVEAYKTLVADLEETAAAREGQAAQNASALDETRQELALKSSDLLILSARVSELEGQARDQSVENERLRQQLMVVELEKVRFPHDLFPIKTTLVSPPCR